MSNVFVIIKMCYVHNQWYDISCATLYNCKKKCFKPSCNVTIQTEYCDSTQIMGNETQITPISLSKRGAGGWQTQSL